MTMLYRVIEVLTNDFGAFNSGQPSTIDETVKWSGTELDELSRKYPPSEIFGADPLGHSEIEDGLIRHSYRFERQLSNGSWEKIDDPRRRLTPITTLEREIDAENRRLFPGDFATDDDCGRCGGYGCEECEDDQREELKPQCYECGDVHTNPALTSDDACKSCQDYLNELMM